jgi:uncharacterized phage-associated protein
MVDRTKAPVVDLRPAANKIIEAILTIIRAAEQHGKQVSQYDIVKSLFLADRAHLNQFGRPITFDNYYAMKHGPVPTFAYDLLKGNEGAWAVADAPKPWTCSNVPGKSYSYFHSQRVPDDNALSPSEVDLLEASVQTVTSLGFGQVRKLTHEDSAYVDAWEDDENGNGSFPMSLSMLFDVPNTELASELSFISKHAM